MQNNARTLCNCVTHFQMSLFPSRNTWRVSAKCPILFIWNMAPGDWARWFFAGSLPLNWHLSRANWLIGYQWCWCILCARRWPAGGLTQHTPVASVIGSKVGDTFWIWICLSINYPLSLAAYIFFFSSQHPSQVCNPKTATSSQKFAVGWKLKDPWKRPPGPPGHS